VSEIIERLKQIFTQCYIKTMFTADFKSTFEDVEQQSSQHCQDGKVLEKCLIYSSSVESIAVLPHLLQKTTASY